MLNKVPTIPPIVIANIINSALKPLLTCATNFTGIDTKDITYKNKKPPKPMEKQYTNLSVNASLYLYSS